MANFRTRVKKKGKRWIKGQSSSSNPTCKLFRCQAKNNFFKENTLVSGSSKLTAESLKQHDNILNDKVNIEHSTGPYSNTETISVNGSIKTYNTFASDWTSCTNMSFNKLVNRFNLANAHHKEMLAILAAITEVIKENGGTENTTEYFAALITTLDTMKENDNTKDSVSAVLSLLCMCIKHVPKGVLQVKFSVVSKILMNNLKKYTDSDDNVILKSIISCMTTLIRLQELNVWNDSSTFGIYDTILNFIIHPKSKIRKSAQHFVCAVLQGSEFLNDENSFMLHPASGSTAKYCIKTLEDNSTVGNMTTVLHLLTVLKEIIHIFPKVQLKTCCETLLKLMTLKNSIVTLYCLDIFNNLFCQRTVENNFPNTLKAQLITALYDYQPASVDSEHTKSWICAIVSALTNLSRCDLSLCMSHVPKFFKVSVPTFLSEKVNVINSTAMSLKKILEVCISLASEPSIVQEYEAKIKKTFEILNNCLNYQYHAAWKQILFLIATMYKVCGKTCSNFMIQCLKNLADLKDNEEFLYSKEVDHVFGCAIETIGPEKIIREIPLQIVNEGAKCEIKRSWLLPLFKEYIKHSTLKCFVDYFLPIASFFKNKGEDLKKTDSESKTALTCDLLQSQIWSLLTSFCNKPSDVAVTFPTVAKSLGNILSTNKELRLVVIIALRKLITSCENDEHSCNTISRYAKNYIPILFNLYTTEPKGTDEESVRFSSLDTIKIYLSISDDSLRNELFDKALQKLESEETTKSKFAKESILDLIGVLLPYQSVESLKILYDKHIVKLIDTNNFKEEKKYFRVLENLCACNSNSCNTFIEIYFDDIKNLLLKSLSKASLPSRGPRIRCLTNLLRHDMRKETIFEYIPETVLCLKDTNSRCRYSAFELLLKIGVLIFTKYKEAGLGEYLDKITSGLVGSPTMIAASILALTYTIHAFKNNIINEQFEAILHNICILATSVTREIVGPALGFIKMIITTYKIEFISPYLELLVKTLSKVQENCKRKYRQKMRDIFDRLVRKFSADVIISFVPTHDGNTITRLKALKKINDRKKKRREQLKESKIKTDDHDDKSTFEIRSRVKSMEEILAECDDDDYDDLEDEEDEKKNKKDKKNKKKSSNNVYLQENEDSIIDFTSTTANKKIMRKNPNENNTLCDIKIKKRKEVEFETAPDGRLIILEEKPQKNSKYESVEPDNESIASDAEAEQLSNLLNNTLISRKRKNTGINEDGPAPKYQAGGIGIHRKINSSSANIKKEKNDFKKKERHEPYTYIPLTRNSLNKRKKKKYSGHFKNIVQSAKKGAAVGIKKKFRKKQNKK